MASPTAASDNIDGPVLSFVNKRLRALRKKYNRIIQMEESVAQGKFLNSEQQEVLRSKTAVSALIDELEKLRCPLAAAVQEEISLAVNRHSHHHAASNDDAIVVENRDRSENQEREKSHDDDAVVEDLLHLLYFGSLFDVKSQSDFTSTMLTRTHERGCCLTYDYVTDDATDLLGERDLDLISMVGSLMISRPVDSGLSHKNALQRCIQHAKLWLANSHSPIEPIANNTYSGLREKLRKIMASDYFTTTPEIKAPVEVAAAAENYASFHAPVHGSAAPISAPFQVEGSIAQSQQKDEDPANFHGHEVGDDQTSPAEEFQKDEQETESLKEVAFQEDRPEEELEQSQRELEPKEQQYNPRRNYQNQRGGRVGGRRGYSNGRGGRGGRGGGGYQNGRHQFYDQLGNYYPRNYYDNRGRSSGRGGGNPYNNGTAAHVGHDTNHTDVGVAS
ncbi:hypothetical protein HS088_TW06G00842 [Tripterygium wilfordii]|uniref:Glycine-rich protein n=1 Tax=Tripterygium wilfordii TaxID=458696 RepID=A0A7J7DJX5_TRIWF|nr:uncharacterized protein LOC120000157 [Tripterygium wilfordii]KAF5746670.1 hypothetical protein HS088_TW06G00842 [Tripterygium wilfordii]